MPRHSEEPARSAAQWQADLERSRELRRQLHVTLAEFYQIWRDCSRKPCRRARRCAGPDLPACYRNWRNAHVDNDMRAILHAWVSARAAGASVAEADAASDRMAARIDAARAEEAAEASAAALIPPASSPRMFQGRCRTL